MLNKLFPMFSDTESQSRPQRHGNSSIEGTQLGWFPSNVSHRERPVKNIQWNDGILLSELVSQLLVDERGLVKQVKTISSSSTLTFSKCHFILHRSISLMTLVGPKVLLGYF